MRNKIPTRLYHQVSVKEAMKINQLVFNKYHIDVYRLATAGNDVDLDYDIYVDKKISMAALVEISSFIDGIVKTLRSF